MTALLDTTFRLQHTDVQVRVLVFDTLKAMRASNPKGLAGADAGCEAMSFDNPIWVTLSFAVKRLYMEYIAHESVHAAMAVGRRGMPERWVGMIGHDEEERIAYPTGYICEGVRLALLQANLPVLVRP